MGTLTDTIKKLCPEGVMKKPTPTERRKGRNLLRDIRDKENEALKRTMRAVFSENESLGSYARKYKTCFEQSSTPKRPKSHTPNYDQASKRILPGEISVQLIFLLVDLAFLYY